MCTPENQGDRDAFHKFCEERQCYPTDALMDAFVVGVRRGRTVQVAEHARQEAMESAPPSCQCDVCKVLRTLWGYGR